MKLNVTSAIIIGLYVLFLLFMAWQTMRFDKRLRADLDSLVQGFASRSEEVE